MIELENITKKFDNQTAVAHLSLQVETGQVVALVGSSGCGKSTTLRMINRLIEPTSGKIIIDGKDITEFDAVHLRRNIGYAIQNHGLFPHWTIEQNIATVPHLLGWDKNTITARIKELMQMFRLDYELFRSQRPAQLSGGQQQRVGVARALAANPDILLMDEPFGALDPITRSEIQEEFLQILSDIKKTVILVTHDIDEAIKLADKIAIMDKGKLIQYDDPQTLLLQPKNQFVSDMIGSGKRGIKLLNRLKVKDRMERIEVYSVNQYNMNDAHHLAQTQNKRIWLVDENRQPIGYASPDPRIEKFIDVQSNAWLTADISLTDALSQMIYYDGNAMAVVDDNGQMIAEIAFLNLLANKDILLKADSQ